MYTELGSSPCISQGASICNHPCHYEKERSDYLKRQYGRQSLTPSRAVSLEEGGWEKSQGKSRIQILP